MRTSVLSIATALVAALALAASPVSAAPLPGTVVMVAEAYPDGTVVLREATEAVEHTASCSGVSPVTPSCGPISHGAATSSQSISIGVGIEFNGAASITFAYAGGGSWGLSCSKVIGSPASCTTTGSAKFGVGITQTCSAPGVGTWSCSGSQS